MLQCTRYSQVKETDIVLGLAHFCLDADLSDYLYDRSYKTMNIELSTLFCIATGSVLGQGLTQLQMAVIRSINICNFKIE